LERGACGQRNRGGVPTRGLPTGAVRGGRSDCEAQPEKKNKKKGKAWKGFKGNKEKETKRHTAVKKKGLEKTGNWKNLLRGGGSMVSPNY